MKDTFRLFITFYLAILLIVFTPITIVAGLFYIGQSLVGNAYGTQFFLGMFLVLGAFSGVVALVHDER